MTDVLKLTRQLVDIESVTNHEAAVGECLLSTLSPLGVRFSGKVERCPVKADVFNVFAHWGDPVVTLSTHMDTVPPFFPSREDGEFVWGRGSADAKGIIASMIGAAEELQGTSEALVTWNAPELLWFWKGSMRFGNR